MRLPRPDALASHPIGRHVLIYSLGAMCVQLVAQGRRVLESAHLLAPPAYCAGCRENVAPGIDAETRTPAPEGDPLTDSPAHDEEAPAPTFGVNGAGAVEQLETVPEQQPPTV